MGKWVLIICFIFFAIFLMGCGSPLFKSLIQEQEWSENYALADGVRCSAPEIIDGDLNTAAKIMFPEKVYGKTILGGVPNAEADIILPEKKSIHKIVIYSDELPSFSILASTGNKDEWKTIAEFDNNDKKEVVIRTSVTTNTIKIRAKAKTTFEGLSSGRVGVVQTAKITEPEIKEVELYGYK